MSMLRPKGKKSLESDLERPRLAKDWPGALTLLRKSGKNPEVDLLESLVSAQKSLDAGDKTTARILLEKVNASVSGNEEALALLGCLETEEGDYKRALSFLEQIDSYKKFSRDANTILTYHMRLLLDALRNKAVCYEHLGRHSDAATAYSEAWEFGVAFFLGSFVDAVCKQCIENIQLRLVEFHRIRGEIKQSVDVCRKILLSPLPPSADTAYKVEKHLGRLLVQQVPGADYTPLARDGPRYVPSDAVEEGLLLLHLYDETHGIGEDEATLFDVFTAGYCKRRGYGQLITVYERLLATRSAGMHFWKQFALTLIAAGKFKRALFIVKQCIALFPSEPVFDLLAAKLCVNHLNQVEQSIKFGREALRKLARLESEAPNNPSKLLQPKAYLSLGISYSSMVDCVLAQDEKALLREKALESLHNAYLLDPHDAHTAYSLGLAYAEIREPSKALPYARAAIDADPSAGHSWNLLALLLTSLKQFKDALIATKAGLQETDDISLLLTKAKIEHVLGQDQHALHTCKRAFELWKNEHKNDQPLSTRVGLNGVALPMSDAQSVFSVKESVKDSLDESLDHKSIITHAMSVVSDNAADADNINLAKAGVGNIDLWLAAAELFTELGEFKEASACTQQARSLSNLCADVYYQEGCIEEAQKRSEAAVEFYEKALAIDPSHVPTLSRLGALYAQLQAAAPAERRVGQPIDVRGESCLTTALRLDPSCHEAWFNLGRVYEGKQDFGRASDCFLTAVELETSAPILPFSILPRSVS
eukprot:TRINITY_DN7387_c0_g1_i1.p1 TRINITY_DN7387_c0_g1~~TRINITY_DN7387_c0_g1_i1.p1  ORF type:complete len:764 (-),score=204.08 TRINITY_DN7387_c0_g1_i1:130-2421(-)